MIESAESLILFWSNTKFGRTGKVAKIQPFNLDGQRGKTRSHYLLVRGSEIDVRMEIISVGCCIIHTQSQPAEPLTTENELSTDGHSGDSQELKVSSTRNPQS